MIPLAILPLFGLVASLGLNFWLVFWELPRLKRDTYQRIELLPDVGDTPGVRPRSNSALDTSDSRLYEGTLPPRLTTALGETLRVGDLEVTPASVELKTVRVFVEGSDRPEPCEGPSLVLNLKLRNLASDYGFTPLDNYFDRNYDKGIQVPLTQLVSSRWRLLGGPARWFPRNRNARERNFREWVEGRKNFDDRGLLPGEEAETLVCTDWKKLSAGDDVVRVADLVNKYQGPLLWRVHVRRGLVRFQDLRRSATAVIGVRFKDTDIRRES
jgi:hypothetical protein